MKLYAELPVYRARQVFGDLFVVAWIVVWVWIGTSTFALIENLAEPGRLLERAGSTIQDSASSASERAAEVPVLGGYLRVPFDSLGRAGRSLIDAGRAQQESVETLALWAGVLVAALPIVYALLKWGTGRWAWSRQASVAQKLSTRPAGTQLLALRAIASRPLADLLRASGDPAGAYGSGDYAPLAGLELERLGLRAPPG
jgi:hypothetical protein